jgi:hypothetical protein
MTCKRASHIATYDAYDAAKKLGNFHSYTTSPYKYIPDGKQGKAQQCKSIFEWVEEVPSKNSDEKEDQESIDYTLVVEKIVNISTGKIIKERGFSTDLKVTKLNIWGIRNVWRKTWKLENNGNNTLKNQGINLEHNYGHGKKHLIANRLILSLLTLLITNLLNHSLIRCHIRYR